MTMNKYINALYSKCVSTIDSPESLDKFIKFADSIDLQTNKIKNNTKEEWQPIAAKLMKFFINNSLDATSMSVDNNLNECVSKVLLDVQGKTITLTIGKNSDITPQKRILLYNIIATNGKFVLDKEINIIKLDDTKSTINVDLNGVNTLLTGLNENNATLQLLKIVRALKIFNVSHELLTKLKIESKYKMLYNISHIINAMNDEELLKISTSENILETYKTILTETTNSGVDNYIQNLLNSNIAIDVLKTIDQENVSLKYGLPKEYNISTVIIKYGLEKYNKTLDINNSIGYKPTKKSNGEETNDLASSLKALVSNSQKVKLPDDIEKKQNTILLINNAISEAITLAFQNVLNKKEYTVLSFDYWKNKKLSNTLGWSLENFAQFVYELCSGKTNFLEIAKIKIDDSSEPKSLKDCVLDDAYLISSNSEEIYTLASATESNMYLNILIKLISATKLDVEKLREIFNEYNTDLKTSNIDDSVFINNCFKSLFMITEQGLTTKQSFKDILAYSIALNTSDNKNKK